MISRRKAGAIPLRATSTIIRTPDGLHLAGTLVTPDGTPERAVVLVHGNPAGNGKSCSVVLGLKQS